MIRLDRVTKTFGGRGGTVVAVDHVSFEVPKGKICVLLGPSGCGKTTTLKMVNRLIEPSAGAIYIDGCDTAGQNAVALRRNIGYVIQQIGLFPNKTIEDNICTVPDLLGWDRRKSRARAAELLELVALDPAAFLKRYPKELSGGQQQRIGVIRAIAADPPVLLMDEPFGAIDPINRAAIQDEFLKMQAALKKTILFVSHDIDEAVKMGDLVAIFRAGRLVQFDTPDTVLARPADAFVADFVGTDRTLKRLRLIKVSEAMAHAPPRVRGEDTLATAAALMERHGHGAVVMVGPKGRARGCVTRDMAQGREGTVGDNHEPLPGTVRTDEDLRAAVSQMFAHGVDWLACIDGDGFYRGYLTQRGITRLLGETYRDG
jgi:osmoprotectant transport system ATP-binding protein